MALKIYLKELAICFQAFSWLCWEKLFFYSLVYSPKAEFVI